MNLVSLLGEDVLPLLSQLWGGNLGNNLGCALVGAECLFYKTPGLFPFLAGMMGCREAPDRMELRRTKLPNALGKPLAEPTQPYPGSTDSQQNKPSQALSETLWDSKSASKFFPTTFHVLPSLDVEFWLLSAFKGLPKHFESVSWVEFLQGDELCSPLPQRPKPFGEELFMPVRDRSGKIKPYQIKSQL